MTPPVCILTSGRGTRMGPYAEIVNKALLPIRQKAAISHIIERFPPDTEFVVATGFLAAQVRTYLALAHPDLRVRFVEVERFEGPGSGPGHSLLCCEPHLQRPFVMVACDTLWWNDLEPVHGTSWVATGVVPAREAASYCNLRVADGRVVAIHDKQALTGDDYRAFAGLCYVHDHARFWEALRRPDPIAGEHQVSNGLAALVAAGELRAVPLDWTDIGDHARYRAALRRHEPYDFSKTNELLYIVNGRVVKFFADARITARRVARARRNPGVFPHGIVCADQFFAYPFAPGRTLYQANDPATFARLLDWLERHVWQPCEVDEPTLTAACTRFYRTKTEERLALYRRKHGARDAAAVINGVAVPPLAALLARVPWDRLARGVPTFFHGDLQFDNVLHDAASGRFTLLDWREDFGGHLEFGDLYYDLAKLYGGIVLNYDLIKQNHLQYAESGDAITYDFAQRVSAATYLDLLARFAARRGLDFGKVRLLVPLIYLNMAPLHHEPFDRLLHALGRRMLSEEVGGAR